MHRRMGPGSWRGTTDTGPGQERIAAMNQPVDNTTAYGHDQDRQPPKSRTTAQRTADRNPDDYGPDAEDGTDVNPDSGVEFGEVDSTPGTRPR